MGVRPTGIFVLRQLHISGGVAFTEAETFPTTRESWLYSDSLFAARELSKLMPLGTIVLVYDKVSFVSQSRGRKIKLKPSKY